MSKTDEAIVAAKKRGYRINHKGEMFGSRGHELKLKTHTSRGYSRQCFSFKFCGSSIPIPVHRFQAFIKYGKRVFVDGIQVRHLDGNSLNNSRDNLALGDQSKNMMDKTPEQRKKQSQKAGEVQGRGEAFWKKVYTDYAAGIGYTKLAAKYKISKGSLSYRLSKTGKRRKHEAY